MDDSLKVKFALIDQEGKKFDSTHLQGHLSLIYLVLLILCMTIKH